MASVPEVVIGLPVTDKNVGTVAATEVTVPLPLVVLMVWLGQVPVTFMLEPATIDGVLVPVPPLTTLSIPLRVTAPVEAVDGLNPVVPALNVVTPPGEPFEAAVMRPWASTVKLVLVYEPAETAVFVSPMVGLLVPLPSVTVIWPVVPVMVRLAMVVPPMMASMPVPDELAIAAATPVNWKVGLPAMPSPLVTDRPKPLVLKVRAAKVVVLVLATMPAPRLSMFATAPVRFTRSVPCDPLSTKLSPEPTVRARLLGSVGSLLAVRKLCVWMGDPASAAVVVCTVTPFWTIGTASVPVIVWAWGSWVMVTLIDMFRAAGPVRCCCRCSPACSYSAQC